jgi:hypothetical protein
LTVVGRTAVRTAPIAAYDPLMALAEAHHPRRIAESILGSIDA